MANKYVLSFEKPLQEMEERIEATKRTALERGIDMSKEIEGLEAKLEKASVDFYQNLTRWQRVQMARHPERPYTLDYVERITRSWFEMYGDRHYADDKAVVGGLAEIDEEKVVIIGQQKGRGTRDNLFRNFGMPRPEGYRKALRLMNLAARFIRPVISLIDTPGAYPGLGAEERGQAEAIARSIDCCMGLRVPIVSIIVGEGGSGGAVAIATANRLYMLEHSIYTVASPEAAASILWRDSSRAIDAATNMKITAQDLLGLKIVDGIIPEPVGGAHRDPVGIVRAAGDVIVQALAEYDKLSPDEIRTERREKFLAMGRAD